MPSWFPESADAVYLDRKPTGGCLPERPLFQGDVFRGIPNVHIHYDQEWRAGNSFPSSEVIGAVSAHSCSCYKGDALEPEQTLIPIVAASSVAAGKPFVAPYATHFYLFPYPDLFLDGVPYVADLRRSFTVATEYLEGKRVAALSEAGWTSLKWRHVQNTTRLELDRDQVHARGVAQWNESELWTEWRRRYGTFAGFNAWLRTPISAGSLKGLRPRDLLEGRAEELRALLPAS